MSVTGAPPQYLTRTHTDDFCVELAQDILADPGTDPAVREWAKHTLTLPVGGPSNLPGEHGTTSTTKSSGNGHRANTGSVAASDKQISALINMGSKKLIGDATVQFLGSRVSVQDIVDRAVKFPETFVTKGEASAALDFLFPAPWKPREVAPRSAAKPTPVKSERITEDGMYTLGEMIIKVQFAKQGSGNLYAKKLVKSEDTKSGWAFEYAPGLVNQLKAEDRMSLEEAKKFGALYGVCCVCAADLTDEKSIAAGIGPICGGRI